MAYTEGTDVKSNIWGMQLDPTGEFYYLPDPEPSLLDGVGRGMRGSLSGGGRGGYNWGDVTAGIAGMEFPKQELKLASDQYAARFGDEIWAQTDKPWLQQQYPDTDWDAVRKGMQSGGYDTPLKKLDTSGIVNMRPNFDIKRYTPAVEDAYRNRSGIVSNRTRQNTIWKPSHAGGYGGL